MYYVHLSVYLKTKSLKNHFFLFLFFQHQKLTPLVLYQSLQKMLNELGNEEEKLNILINFLIEPFMLEVYFTTLMGKLAKNSVDLQRECLKFLNTLQRYYFYLIN